MSTRSRIVQRTDERRSAQTLGTATRAAIPATASAPKQTLLVSAPSGGLRGAAQRERILEIFGQRHQGPLQRRAAAVGSVGISSHTHFEGVAQRAEVVGHNGSPHPLRSEADVQEAVRLGDTVQWPEQKQTGFDFDASAYAGSVKLALDWGLKGGPGTAGWNVREYGAADFKAIASASEKAWGVLTPALKNKDNMALISIRAFRGPSDGSMAAQTGNALITVLSVVSELASGLYSQGLIADADAVVTSVEADPAEAHPNTLPTAKIVFGGAGSVYFKSRSSDVEAALVGSEGSAARALSSIQGANPEGPEAVGTHRIVNSAANQIAEDVGEKAIPRLDQVTVWERVRSHLPVHLWGAAVPPRRQAVAAWLSAAKSALLASLTASNDLHSENVKVGRSGKAHIIDGEFLLDVTLWDVYARMLSDEPLMAESFAVMHYVPGWLQDHMKTLSPETTLLMADAVAATFAALRRDEDAFNGVLNPIRSLLEKPVLLRVSPWDTTYFLRFLPFYNNASTGERIEAVTRLWVEIGKAFQGKITIGADARGRDQLNANFALGMVPLFHVRSSDGVVLMNKLVPIGRTVQGRGVADLLNLVVRAVSHRYSDMTALVRQTVVNCAGAQPRR